MMPTAAALVAEVYRRQRRVKQQGQAIVMDYSLISMLTRCRMRISFMAMSSLSIQPTLLLLLLLLLPRHVALTRRSRRGLAVAMAQHQWATVVAR